MSALNTEIRRVKYGDCKAQEVNARFMRKEQYDQLVANLKRDGVLTSVPLLYQPAPDAPLEIVSGHHRIQAGTEAFGRDAEFDAMVVLDEQSKQEIIARQVSHNAIAGEDDLATLQQMYDELDDVDWRAYTGLDDKMLALMAEVDLSSLAEANLTYHTVQLLFLPNELDEALAAFDEARKLIQADDRWLAANEQYEALSKALESARASYSIGNVATALGIVLEVFERNIGDLAEGFYDPVEKVALTTKHVPVEAVVGARAIPADAAAVILQAMKKARKDAELAPTDAPWRAIEVLAAEFLAGE